MNNSISSSNSYAPFQPLPADMPNYSFAHIGEASNAIPRQFSYGNSIFTHSHNTFLHANYPGSFQNIYGSATTSTWHDPNLGHQFNSFTLDQRYNSAIETLLSVYGHYNEFDSNMYQQPAQHQNSEVIVEEIDLDTNQEAKRDVLTDGPNTNRKRWNNIDRLLERVEASEAASQYYTEAYQEPDSGYFRQDSNEYNNYQPNYSDAYTFTNEYSYLNQGAYANQNVEAQFYAQEAASEPSYPQPSFSSSVYTTAFSYQENDIWSSYPSAACSQSVAEDMFSPELVPSVDSGSPSNREVVTEKEIVVCVPPKRVDTSVQHELEFKNVADVDADTKQAARQLDQHTGQEIGDDKDINQLCCCESTDDIAEERMDSWTLLSAEIHEKRRELVEDARAEANDLQSSVVIEEVDANENQEVSDALRLTYETEPTADSISSSLSSFASLISYQSTENNVLFEDDTEEFLKDEHIPNAKTGNTNGDKKKSRFQFRMLRSLRSAIKSSLNSVKTSFGCCFGFGSR